MTDYPSPHESEFLSREELDLDVVSTDSQGESLEYLDAEALASFNLKRIRAALNVSQQEIADRLKETPGAPRLSQSQIAKIERGERPWKVNELTAIAGVLNLHFDEFFQGMGTAGNIDLEIANSRIRLRTAEFEEEFQREKFLAAKREVRAAEDRYLALVAQRGTEDPYALRILHFRYYLNEARAAEEELDAFYVDEAAVDAKSRAAEEWARAEFDRLRQETKEHPVVTEPARDERFPDPEVYFAESVRKRANGLEESPPGIPIYLRRSDSKES